MKKWPYFGGASPTQSGLVGGGKFAVYVSHANGERGSVGSRQWEKFFSRGTRG